MHSEYENISCQEFRQLLTRLNGDTALGNLVRIRAEKDPKKIRQMSKEEKEIRTKWAQFRNKKKNNVVEIKTEDISKVFSKMFG